MKTKIVIVVEGDTLQKVLSSNDDVEIIFFDMDIAKKDGSRDEKDRQIELYMETMKKVY